MLTVPKAFICMAMVFVINGQYSDWSPWSLCDRVCGRGSQDRYRLCKSSPCYPNLTQWEERQCFWGPCNDKDFPPDGLCADQFQYLSINGTKHGPSFPYLPGTVYTCQSFIEFQSVTMAYTVLGVYFRKHLTCPSCTAVTAIRVKYKHPLQGNTFLNYPSDVSQTVGVNQLYNKWFQATEVRVEIAGRSPPTGQPPCYSVALYGCHTPIVNALMFSTASFQTEILMPVLTPQEFSFTCTTYADRNFHQYMFILDRIGSRILSSSTNQTKYTAVRTTNCCNSDDISEIDLILVVNSIEQLLSDYSCMVHTNGYTYCTGLFTCLGPNDGVKGHFMKSTLEVQFYFMSNPCLLYCYPGANCTASYGSVYCVCPTPLVGNGVNCYAYQDWCTRRLGPFWSSQCEAHVKLDSTDLRQLFYASISGFLLACAASDNETTDSGFGCMKSIDEGMTWQETHPYLERIIGEDHRGRIYGPGPINLTYLVYMPEHMRWFSVNKSFYQRATEESTFKRECLLQPKAYVEVTVPQVTSFPLKHAILEVGNARLTMTMEGVSRMINESSNEWRTVLKWSQLPGRL